MVIAIYGLGLIGGSFGRAILEKTPHKVLGRDIDPQTVIDARLLKAIDDEITDENLKDVDLAIFALSPSDAISEMEKAAPKLKDGAVIIDSCGTKRRVIRCMESLRERYPNLEFAGVHPMAGREIMRDIEFGSIIIRRHLRHRHTCQNFASSIGQDNITAARDWL